MWLLNRIFGIQIRRRAKREYKEGRMFSKEDCYSLVSLLESIPDEMKTPLDYRLLTQQYMRSEAMLSKVNRLSMPKVIREAEEILRRRT